MVPVIDGHEMIMVRKYPTGARQWRCPVCGRMVILYKDKHALNKVVLKEGDTDAAHVMVTAVEERVEVPGQPDDLVGVPSWRPDGFEAFITSQGFGEVLEANRLNG